MAMPPLNDIDLILSLKNSEKFTGAIKFGIEDGKIVHVNEANSFDVPFSLSDLSLLYKVIRENLKATSSGSIIIKMTDGNITGYAYSQVYKGDNLRRLLAAVRA